MSSLISSTTLNRHAFKVLIVYRMSLKSFTYILLFAFLFSSIIFCDANHAMLHMSRPRVHVSFWGVTYQIETTYFYFLQIFS